jgi:hypothetical protein
MMTEFTTYTKNHWSCLLFIEERIVNHGGSVQRGRSCPHMNDDDWIAVDDFIKHGLLRWEGTGMNPVFKLTPLGWAVAHAARRTRAEGSKDYARNASTAANMIMMRQDWIKRHSPTSIVS